MRQRVAVLDDTAGQQCGLGLVLPEKPIAEIREEQQRCEQDQDDPEGIAPTGSVTIHGADCNGMHPLGLGPPKAFPYRSSDHNAKRHGIQGKCQIDIDQPCVPRRSRWPSRRRSSPRFALAGLISIAAFGACSAPTSPNIVLITIDTLRADHCSVYGYGLRTTPHLEKLAREGARVETAYVPMPSTGPAHASLFTSRYPLAHQVLKNGHVLADEYPVLAEVLGEAGYRTAAFVSSFVLDERFGYGQGFESYDDDFRGADSSYKNIKHWEGIEVPGEFDRRAHETTDRAISWLRENGTPRRVLPLGPLHGSARAVRSAGTVEDEVRRSGHESPKPAPGHRAVRRRDRLHRSGSGTLPRRTG